MIHCFISFAIYLLVFLPAAIIGVPIVAVLLLTSWNGRTTIFGNQKWGRANDHFAYPTNGYWQEFLWLVWRNPVNNLCTCTLALKQQPYTLKGDTGIGDKLKGGFYVIRMGLAWEYYWIMPYGSRCVRARIGWKIYGNSGPAAFVFAVNPWKSYTGK